MPRASLLSLSLLFACSSDSTDSSADTGSADTAPAADPLTMKAFFEDGLTGNALKKASICVEEPEIEGDTCFETNFNGVLNWTWEEPRTSNFLLRFTLEDYMPTVFTGRYTEDLAAASTESLKILNNRDTLQAGVVRATPSAPAGRKSLKKPAPRRRHA